MTLKDTVPQSADERLKCDPGERALRLATAAINEEAEAQRAVYAAEDTLAPLERELESMKAAADYLGAQGGTNDIARKALAVGHLTTNEAYQKALADAEAVRRDLREQRVALAVAGHMRALALLAVRLETARLAAEGSR